MYEPENQAVEWRAADAALRPFVLGFVQRTDGVALGPSLQLPFAVPVIHLTFTEGRRPRVAICAGADVAVSRPATPAGKTFVIALGFAGAARFAPDGLAASLNGFVQLDDAGWTRLAERVGEAIGFGARVEAAESCLLAIVRRDAASASPILAAADAIVQDRWTGRVRDLAARLGLEERTLRNRFHRELGWSPKRLLGVSRFTRAVRAIHPRPWTGRSANDARLEFFDEAHFHRAFLAHAGVTPAAFAAAKRGSCDRLIHTLHLPLLPPPG